MEKERQETKARGVVLFWGEAPQKQKHRKSKISDSAVYSGRTTTQSVIKPNRNKRRVGMCVLDPYYSTVIDYLQSDGTGHLLGVYTVKVS